MDNVKILAGDKDISGLSNVATFTQSSDSRNCNLSFRVFFGVTGASSVAALEELSRATSSWVCRHEKEEYKFRGQIKEYSVECAKGTGSITCSVVVEGTSSTPAVKLVEPRFEKGGSEKKLEVEYGQNSR